MAVNELDTTPVYTPYVAGYGRKKTSNGLVINEYATLKRYYSSIDIVTGKQIGRAHV